MKESVSVEDKACAARLKNKNVRHSDNFSAACERGKRKERKKKREKKRATYKVFFFVNSFFRT